jgi:hypothetical protein
LSILEGLYYLTKGACVLLTDITVYYVAFMTPSLQWGCVMLAAAAGMLIITFFKRKKEEEMLELELENPWCVRTMSPQPSFFLFFGGGFGPRAWRGL